MKNKILALGLVCAMALSLAACGGESSDTKVIEGNATQTASSSESSSGGYTFTYDSTNIAVDTDAAPVIEKLGEPKSYFESPSCAADGIGKLYTYNDFEIQTYPDGDKDLILYVLLRTDNVATAEGIDLSSSRDDIIAAYGEPTSEATGAMTYEKNGTKLVFIFDGDSLISIEYDSPKN
ncbi:hypothetical protein [Pseudobutyrivibrio xylanivorans]|uniref:DUF4309 domain-containing protein n=1 Tax=Pseudobutyrivibrio xylanivorans TaxID=185007 RepID=A0A5P6VSG0_PSEXY|nr:hypothetical protein [Pseudobutyrivibrio xylanivorans]QFJ53781.1 hypothetical protein FXF36_02300 [Pseudobutyrivibrio xylanivorans]